MIDLKSMIETFRSLHPKAPKWILIAPDNRVWCGDPAELVRVLVQNDTLKIPKILSPLKVEL